MKKEECCSVFMTTLMIAIPIGAVIILIVYVFGIVAVPKDKTTYDFIKDHGSLIAGIFAVLAVVATITYQNINTTKQIQAQNNLSTKNRVMDKQEEVIVLLAASSKVLSKTIDGYGKTISPIGFTEKDLWSDYVMHTSRIYSLTRKYELVGKDHAYELMSLASLSSFLVDRIYYVNSLDLNGSKSTKDFMMDLLEACQRLRDLRKVSNSFDDLIQYIINIAWLNSRSGNDVALLTSLLEKIILSLIRLNDNLNNSMMNQ